MKHFTKKLLCAVTALLFGVIPLIAQNPIGYVPGKYGLSSWAINNQRVASQYNYFLDATIQNGFGTWNFPAYQIQNLLNFSGRSFNPFNTNAPVKVIDINSANTETLVLSSASCSGNLCTIALASAAYTHNSFVLRSGTCGLDEAINDLGVAGGEVIIDQGFYDAGCTASTITGTTAGLAVPYAANVYLHDISNGKDQWYNVQPTTLSALAVPTTSANLTCAATAGLVCQSATVGGIWPNSAEYVGDIYVDALGGWSVASTTATLTPSASGTNILQFNSPAASAGAVGWLPFGGLAYNSTTYVLPVTASNCVLSTAYTGYPVCAMGAAATMLGPVVTTSLIPQSGGIAA